MRVTTNKQFSLKGRDFWLGLLQAVGTVVLTLLLDQLKAGLGYDWSVLLDAAIAAAITYLLRNFFEPSKTMAIAESEAEARSLVVSNNRLKK